AELFLYASLGISFRSQSEYVERPAIRKVVLSLNTGPSIVRRASKSPTPPEPEMFFLFPSRVVTSRTDDSLPPYFSGMLLLYNSTPFTTSGLNEEKKPKKWVGL